MPWFVCIEAISLPGTPCSGARSDHRNTYLQISIPYAVPNRIASGAFAIMMAGWTLLFISGAETAPCPGGTVDIHVTEAGDLPRLSDVLNCTGGGVFNISWLSSLYIPQVIEVSSSKVVTVTGSGFPTISGVLNDDVDAVDVEIDSGSTSGMFSVSDGSTLSINDIVMNGGQSEEGGAIAVLSSSSLWVSGCTFKNNNASTGGESLLVATIARTTGSQQRRGYSTCSS